MDEVSNKWAAYIDAEVRAACEKKGWGYQIRRKLSVRDKPVSESLVDDYEWKLVPGADDKLPEQPSSDFDEGIYYVLRFDPRGGKFILQHDTAHCGITDSHWNLQSFTEIRLVGPGNPDYLKHLRQVGGTKHEASFTMPPQDGWLRDILTDLTSHFKPNHFSIT